MGRVRELLAHGGIAVLAFVFALAFAAFNLSVAFAREVISALQQHLVDDEGRGFYSFTIFDTEIAYVDALYYAVAVALLAAGLLAVWLVTRNRMQTCDECKSRVPVDATVCRFCTSELHSTSVDA